MGVPGCLLLGECGVGGPLTVHVISILFLLVPSPFTSLGLDSGAGTQTDKGEVKPEPDQGTPDRLPPT